MSATVEQMQAEVHGAVADWLESPSGRLWRHEVFGNAARGFWLTDRAAVMFVGWMEGMGMLHPVRAYLMRRHILANWHLQDAPPPLG